jgi:hypothetical protein
MLAIVLNKISTLDANILASAKQELIRAADVFALVQNKIASESPCNQSRRRLETVIDILCRDNKAEGL